jgi:hypothetical protein
MGNRKIKLGIYQYYKGGMVEVIALANHSETLEEMVVYKTLYENRSFGKGSLWVRPIRMFFEDVNVNGVTVPRFRYKKEKTP